MIFARFVFLHLLLAPFVLASDGTGGGSRGYVTTPQELAHVRRQAKQGVEPYASAVRKVLEYANEPVEAFNSPDKDCVRQNAYYRNSYRLLAKAMAYHLTQESAYADEVVAGLRDAVGNPSFRAPSRKGDQCNLNAAWYTQAIIQAADLLETYPAWTATDKKAFQEYLANSVYPFAEAASHRANNWGTAGSCAAAYIADYLWDRPELKLRSLDGQTMSPARAYQYHKKLQIARINGQAKLDGGKSCAHTGIRPDGGMPLELKRGSTGCSGRWIHRPDKSLSYTITSIETLLLHAELLLRRGDRSLYNNVAPDGSGSILKAIHFVIRNPNDPARSVGWKKNHLHALELAYRYYRDSDIGKQLAVEDGEQRHIGGKCGQALHFGTVSHGFASSENPGPPPTVSAP